jgi:hypothetical protein
VLANPVFSPRYLAISKGKVRSKQMILSADVTLSNYSRLATACDNLLATVDNDVYLNLIRRKYQISPNKKIHDKTASENIRKY